MTPPSGFDPFTHASELHTIDLSKHPTDPGFIISTQPDLGTTPALIGNRIYTTSNTGIGSLVLRSFVLEPSIREQFRAVVDGKRPMKELIPAP